MGLETEEDRKAIEKYWKKWETWRLKTEEAWENDWEKRRWKRKGYVERRREKKRTRDIERGWETRENEKREREERERDEREREREKKKIKKQERERGEIYIYRRERERERERERMRRERGWEEREDAKRRRPKATFEFFPPRENRLNMSTKIQMDNLNNLTQTLLFIPFHNFCAIQTAGLLFLLPFFARVVWGPPRPLTFLLVLYLCRATPPKDPLAVRNMTNSSNNCAFRNSLMLL